MTQDYRGGNLNSNICNSVHQLQNLYFALTGTELELITDIETN